VSGASSSSASSSPRARAERQAVFGELLPLQRADFIEIFEAMDGLPVTVRLLDPPLHEFLPDFTELSVKVAVAEATGREHDTDSLLLLAVQRLHEENPMLGLRGVRLGLVDPGPVRDAGPAILEAAAIVAERGGHARPEIMVPLVGAVEELRPSVSRSTRPRTRHGSSTPSTSNTSRRHDDRAAPGRVTAGEIAQAADFFSFGTNDLTQTTWGFSRDDVESSFFSRYMEKPASSGRRRSRHRP
jgi:pyruvate,orthophosphate dikinase